MHPSWLKKKNQFCIYFELIVCRLFEIKYTLKKWLMVNSTHHFLLSSCRFQKYESHISICSNLDAISLSSRGFVQKHQCHQLVWAEYHVSLFFISWTLGVRCFWMLKNVSNSFYLCAKEQGRREGKGQLCGWGIEEEER